MKKDKNKPNFFGFSLAVENTPTFSEMGNKDYINYGEDNLYPNYLVSLMNGSSKHNAILKRKTDLIASGGWNLENDFTKNSHGSEDLNNIVYKNAYDLDLFGSFAMIITWSKDLKSIARIKFISIDKIRIVKDVDVKSELYERQQDGVDFYLVSDDWTNTRKAKNKPQLIQGFSEEYKDETTQLVYVKEYRPGVEYYTLPDYIAAINWIEIDKEIANFHLKSIQNGFTPSMIISFNQGVPTEEEQKVLYKKIQNKYAGSDNASKVFITFSEGGDQKPDFIPITLNDSDERFIMLEEHIMSNIVVAHRIPPIIAGVQVAGKLGGSDEVMEQELIFQSQVIESKQNLIERTYNLLFNIGTPNETLELNEVSTINITVDEATVVDDTLVEDVVPAAVNENALAQANLRGSVGGVNGILQIQASFSQGLTTKGSAITILVEIYGFSEDVAKDLLGIPDETDTLLVENKLNNKKK